MVFWVSRSPTISISSPTLTMPRSTRPGDDRAAARDREHVFDRHQERLVDRALRLRNVGIDRLHQLQDRVVTQLRILVLESGQRRALDDRNVVAREVVLGEQLAHFHLDQFEQFRIVDHVALVEEHDQRGNADLARQQDVLAGLRHRAVSRRDDENAAVHLRRTGDHVLDIIGVAGAIDVGVMPVGGLVFDVRRRDRDAARLLFRRLVDLVIGRERRTARFRQHLGDRRRQRRLAVVDVTDRSDVAMRLITFKLCFGHDPPCYASASARHQTGGWLQGKTALFKPELLGQSRQTMPVKPVISSGQ